MEDVSKSEIMTSSSMGAHASASSSSRSHYSTALTESIEESKVHWSILLEGDSELTDDQIVASNIEVYKSLRLSHPGWGGFFIPFIKNGIFEVQDKFAEGAQAEIFNASMKRVDGEEDGWVLKVFKKGVLLQNLQSQWPHGYVQWMGEREDSPKDGIYWERFVASLWAGTLLPTGQFAFVMVKEDGDLRALIVRNKSYCSHDCGPFDKQRSGLFFYQIAAGMDWLHKHNIIHRDLKASNVLVTKNRCVVADFECSIGVVGTGYWRDPQILQACIERNTSQRPELFTRAADVYSYGMTCYEILTGKIPFEGEAITMDLVVKGHRTEVPEFIDDWMKDLLCKCWEGNRNARPSFEEILNIIVANTTIPSFRSQHVWRMKMNNDEYMPLLGCEELSHGIEMMEHSPYESGTYVCKLCLKEGHGVVYHCNSCSDFDLHPGCANFPTTIEDPFLHPHRMYLQLGFEQKGKRIICDACQLDILQGFNHISYKCHEDECDFDLHIQCARYARTISHQLHEEHELKLIHSSTFVGVEEGSQECNGCNIKLDPLEIVYSCRDCGFNIHPYCIIGRLESKS